MPIRHQVPCAVVNYARVIADIPFKTHRFVLRRAMRVHKHRGIVCSCVSVATLKDTVVRVVQNTTQEVDRRLTERHASDRTRRLRLNGGGTLNAQVFNLSESGALVAGDTGAQVGMAGVIMIDGTSVELPFSVIHVNAKSDGAHMGIAFRLKDQARAAIMPLLNQPPGARAA